MPETIKPTVAADLPARVGQELVVFAATILLLSCYGGLHPTLPKDRPLGFGHGALHGATDADGAASLVLGKTWKFSRRTTRAVVQIGYMVGINLCGLLVFGSAFWSRGRNGLDGTPKYPAPKDPKSNSSWMGVWGIGSCTFPSHPPGTVNLNYIQSRPPVGIRGRQTGPARGRRKPPSARGLVWDQRLECTRAGVWAASTGSCRDDRSAWETARGG